MKKRLLIVPLIVWFTISGIEIGTQVLVPKDWYFWRAWEKVITNASSSPFLPNATFHGTIHGDLLNLIYFTPQQNELREQTFLVDEYGFRNPKYMTKSPIEIVVLGTSLVAGASETQSHLVSTLLTNQYLLPTYNYATASLHQFLADERFQQHPPRYVLLLGKDTEIVHNMRLTNTSEIAHTNKQQKKDFFSYATFTNSLTQFSFTRSLLTKALPIILNTFFPRNVIAQFIPHRDITYDQTMNTLFLSIEQDNPTVTTDVNQQITDAIHRLKHIQETLAKRQSILLVASVPSKGELYATQYQTIPKTKRLSVILEQRLEKSGITIVPLATEMFVKKNTVPLYYSDDSHWSAAANQIIAKHIADKLLKQ